MKLVMFHIESSAVGLYRIWQPAKYLERKGHEVKYWPYRKLPNKTVKGWQDFFDDFQPDLFVGQRISEEDTICFFMGLKETYKVPFVAEIDDNLFSVPEYSVAYHYYRPRYKHSIIAAQELRDCSAITTTTKPLYHVYKKLNPDCYILPNYIDFETWDKVKIPRHKKTINIGWAGGIQHYGDFDPMMGALEQILEEFPQVRLVFMGLKADWMFWFSRPKQIRILKHTYCKKYPQGLADMNMDIGIAPLIVNRFNQGKSNIKYLEFSALRVPGVYSRVYPYSQSIKNGETGFLASSPKEWLRYLRRLIKDEELRQEMGQNAYNNVKERFGMQDHIHEWEDVYEKVLRES